MYSDGENFIVSAVQLHVHVYCIPVCCTYIEDVRESYVYRVCVCTHFPFIVHAGNSARSNFWKLNARLLSSPHVQ